jgi:dCTP deaminase
MILTGKHIQQEVESKNITISPFDPKQMSTNSYDLRLGKNLIRYTEPVLDPKKQNKYETIEILESGFLLNKGDFVLASTLEIIGSNNYVPIIHAKSGIARMGLFVHITADLIDIGSIGSSTLQLYATLPIKIYTNMLIAQVSFWKTLGKIELYNGKYSNSNQPQASKIYQDFLEE